MTYDSLTLSVTTGYVVLFVLWLYTGSFSLLRARDSRHSNLIVSRLYTVLAVGSACAIVACLNDFVRLFQLLNSGASPADQRLETYTMVLPILVNATALGVALSFAVRGGLQQIVSHDEMRKKRQAELEALVEQRTVELHRTIERLERDEREREQIADELRAEHALLDAIMKTSVGAICVVNAEGQITFANDLAQSVLGVSPDEATKRRYNAPEWQQTDIEGNPLGEADMPFRRVLDAGVPIHNMRQGIMLPDGTRRLLEISGAPLAGVDGAIAAVVFLITDITQRVEDEAILRDSEKRFRLMVEGLPIGAVFVEADRIHMNRAAENITGYSRAELTTVNQWFWALYGEGSAEARAKYERIRDAGFVEVCVGTIRRKDGEMRTIECGGYRSQHATVWLLHDITDQARSAEERRRFESQLYETQTLENLAVMAEGVAHDCNNILTEIIGSAELARHEIAAGDSARRYIETMAEGARRAAELCTMMMAYAEKAELSPTPVDINAAAQEMVRFMQGAAGAAPGVTVKYRLDSAVGMAQAGAAQIRKVLLALLNNAAEAIGSEGGTITVSSGRLRLEASANGGEQTPRGLPPGDYVVVSISDTGCGMDGTALSRAFNPFYTTKQSARGLGLSYALEIVRAYSGTIDIKSEKGRGTTATVYLPAAVEYPVEHETPVEPEGLWHGSGTILVVDDELNVRTITKRMLEKLGFNVVLAGDLREAMRELDRHDGLSAVILDLTMPTVDGQSAYDEIHRNYPQLPVLIATGYDVKRVTNRFPDLDASAFLQKPFPMHVLSSHLRDALKRSPGKKMT